MKLYKSRFKKLFNLWHPLKNIPNNPTDFHSQSNKKMWWQCEKNSEHIWEQKISHITNGVGCPFCSNKKVSKDNNFGFLHSDKIIFWDWSKNKDISPFQFVPGSDKKIWWKCENNHEWFARIAQVSKRGANCPKCNNLKQKKRMIKKGVINTGSLFDKHPELIKEWDYEKNTNIDPKNIGTKSGIRAWWVCNQGHRWQTPIRHRVEGTRCPKCNPSISKLELRIFCELRFIFQNIVPQKKFGKFFTDILIPEHKIIIEVDGYPWHDGKELKDQEKSNLLMNLGYSVIRLRDARLKSISKEEIIFKDKDSVLLIVKKLLHKLKFILKINDKEKQLIKKYLSSKDYLNNDFYLSKLSTILIKDPLKKLTKYSKISSEWDYKKNHPLIPENFQAGSGKKVWWKCIKGHEWKTSIHHRTHRNSNCNKCVRSKSGLKFKRLAVIKSGSLAKKNPKLAKEWNYERNKPLLPSDRSPGSHDLVWWKCKDGHEWKAIINSRSRGNGCNACYLINKTKKKLKQN